MRWDGQIIFSLEFTPSTTLRACPERSRTGQALSEAEEGKAVLLLFWFGLFAEGEKAEPKEIPVHMTTDETRRRMPTVYVRP